MRYVMSDVTLEKDRDRKEKLCKKIYKRKNSEKIRNRKDKYVKHCMIGRKVPSYFEAC
jgi:hypothetical protein